MAYGTPQARLGAAVGETSVVLPEASGPQQQQQALAACVPASADVWTSHACTGCLATRVVTHCMLPAGSRVQSLSLLELSCRCHAFTL